ncbi:hypothetical protein QZH41_017324 [Actinostola sp. cb2023]|nr:hypothetical protein QZH41_017324 [Actinostola sp. cb2023]
MAFVMHFQPSMPLLGVTRTVLWLVAGVGKKKAWNILKQSNVHQESLSLLGQDPILDETTAGKCEAFICDLYPCSRKAPGTADERRYIIFCQTSDSLQQHIQRANYQACVWRRSLTAMQNLPQPEGHGWEMEDGVLQPVLMTKEPAPKSLLELTTCHCKKSECRTNCSCNNTGLACTEACVCMADETVCKNPNSLFWQYSSDSADESDSDDSDSN